MMQVDIMKFAALISWLTDITGRTFDETECRELLKRFGATLSVPKSSIDDLMAAIFADAPNKY